MGLKKIELRAYARLHPLWIGGSTGYAYSVIFRGELIVDKSRDPECDAARALLARGHTGRLTMLDGKTGKPRTIINIEKAAKLRTVEPNRGPLHFQRWKPFDASHVNRPSPDEAVPSRMRAEG